MTFLSSEHRQMLLDSAITPEVIEASGIRSTPSGIEFPWCDGVGSVVWQSRPDEPFLNEEGEPVKYLFPKDAQVPFNRLRDSDNCTRMILAEGTKQQYAVLSHAPADMAVYGVSGCWGFKHADMTVAKGREVFLLLDADYATNSDVYAAAEQFSRQLTKHGATAVRYVSTTGTGKDGVDDVLAGFPGSERAEMLRLWLSQAEAKLGKRPKGKRPKAGTDGPEQFFRQRDKPLALQPMIAAEKILSETPLVITAEKTIAVYENGVYQVNEDAILSRVVRMFGNYFTPSVDTTITKFLRGLLAGEGRALPERMNAPLLNCRNTMVDLRTGKTLSHDPAFMSSVQVSVDYEENADCPVYDAWLREALRQEDMSEAELDALVDGLEETAGTMLDPSKTPSKALFLFGPSRSGKSTFLRLLRAVAGPVNTSAVTLHDLVSDQFAAANLYGKMLNVAADLSNKHVSDLSTFKMLTGEDAINGNRKYGAQFSFTNQSLIAFSANELPTVSEASRAYVERMWPVNFPNSFAGREDKTLEDKLMAELPGILTRWVRAYGRFLARGGYTTMHRGTQDQFESKSDRVVQFFQDMCTVTPANHGQRLPSTSCTKRRDVAELFNAWSDRNGGSHMGERAFFQRMASITGVVEVMGVEGTKRNRSYNLIVAKAEDDVWAADEPELDPIDPSGVEEPEGNPWAPQSAPAAPVTAAVQDEIPGALEWAQSAVQDRILTASAATTRDEFADFMEMDLGYEI